jgi:hypothetical protein
MLLLAWLAYPKKEDRSKRQHFFNACVSMLVRRRRSARSDPELRIRVERLDPTAFSLKDTLTRRDVNNELSRADRLIRNRLTAADMQAPQCLRVFDNQYFPFADKMVRLRIKGASTRRMATAVARGSRQDIEEGRVNVTSRIWSESKPVMHLAAALRLWLSKHKGKKVTIETIGRPGRTRQVDLGDLDLVRLVCCPDWLGEVILWAEAFRLPLHNGCILPGMECVAVSFLPAD